MRGKRRWLEMLVLAVLMAPGWAAYPAASWEGLTGLYTLPTAETLAVHDATLTFSEIRFAQSNGTHRIRNTWYTGTVAYAPLPGLEVAAGVRHDILDTFPYVGVPTSEGVQKLLVHAKYQLVPPGVSRVGLALGAQDLTDRTAEFRGSQVDRGRRLFLVGTYRWATLGITHDRQGISYAAGARWSLSDQLELLGEYNFNPVFLSAGPAPANDANFNLGLRIYPREVPNLRVDLTAVGDGRFDFGFSFSYLVQ